MHMIQETLKTARAYIDSESKWSKGCFGRDAENNMVDYKSETACKFCSTAAVLKARTELGVSEDDPSAFLALSAQAPGGVMWHFNDNEATSHADVMQMFDKAINAASAMAA